MENKLVQALNLTLEPVVLAWANEKPDCAVEFGAGKWGCIMFHLVAAAKGKTAVISRESYGCAGGGVGMGFGNCYEQFPGGCDCFYRFLSSGNKGVPMGEMIGRGIAESGNLKMAHEYLEGERYLKNADAARRFVNAIAPEDIPSKYVVLRPMKPGDLEDPQVRSITMLVTPDQLSALVFLAHYEHPERENVIAPFAAGCQVIGLAMYKEFNREFPRALIGMTDISARKNTRHILSGDLLSFSVIPPMFTRLESHVRGSFLERDNWKELVAGK